MNGKEFKLMRERAGLTQRAFADCIEKTIFTVSKWENAHRVPPMAEYALRGVVKDGSIRETVEVAVIEAPKPIPSEDMMYIRMHRGDPDALTDSALARLMALYPDEFKE